MNSPRMREAQFDLDALAVAKEQKRQQKEDDERKRAEEQQEEEEAALQVSWSTYQEDRLNEARQKVFDLELRLKERDDTIKYLRVQVEKREDFLRHQREVYLKELLILKEQAFHKEQFGDDYMAQVVTLFDPRTLEAKEQEMTDQSGGKMLDLIQERFDEEREMVRKSVEDEYQEKLNQAQEELMQTTKKLKLKVDEEAAHHKAETDRMLSMIMDLQKKANELDKHALQEQEQKYIQKLVLAETKIDGLLRLLQHERQENLTIVKKLNEQLSILEERTSGDPQGQDMFDKMQYYKHLSNRQRKQLETCQMHIEDLSGRILQLVEANEKLVDKVARIKAKARKPARVNRTIQTDVQTLQVY